MFPLWDVAIAPVLRAAGARKVVEIGALRGENTVQILEHLGPEAVLHVIDPVPDFDPGEHERMFPGQYVFHEALSLDVLPDLEPMDAALIDGDHNWWTVYNECRMLAASATRAGVPMPVMILHDVCWPYGRRDLYYDPSNVPEEQRQPFAYRGIRRGQSKLAFRGGMNPTMANALEEGGERNGVLTGLDDFEAEYPKPLRRIVLPFYFGMAIVAEEERLAAEPELAAAFDRLESADARYEMLEVAEDVHLKAMLLQHQFLTSRDRLADRYLAQVKKTLLNEHYLDLEVRLAQLEECLDTGSPARPRELRDPARHDRERYKRIERPRTGVAGPTPHQAENFLPLTAMGRPRLDHLHAVLDATRPLGADLVDVGTGRGGAAIFMRAWLDTHELKNRTVWVADAFRAASEGETDATMPSRGMTGFVADLTMVRDAFERFDLLDDQVRFVQGDGTAPLVDASIERIGVLRIGSGQDAAAVLDALYDAVVPDGHVVVEVADESVRAAVEAFRSGRGITRPLESVDAHTVTWIRSADDRVAEAPVEVSGRTGAPLASPTPTGVVDLTVVVVFYDMRREAARTLHSLSRQYQEGMEGHSYEVLAVDNGSSPEQRLDEAFVSSFGPEFRLIDMGEDATSSPVPALNRGIAEGRGRNFTLMIDGAHVLTPGVLHYGLLALDVYGPAIVATQQWFVGPGQQGAAMVDGYDQDFEDRLFERINWPQQGYRLFDISHFVGDRDWLDGVWESNCLFATRAQLASVGGFDGRFDEAGGGYANLEIYERLGSDPNITVCSLLGEGSFHQIHGGTTTNQPDAERRRARVHGYGEKYAAMRGRAFKGPGKPLHFVGRIPTDSARRTKPRRLSARIFNEAGASEGLPEHPLPIADGLVEAFTESVWNTLPWRATTWLGRVVESAPTDLLAYQELVSRVRPDFIVETGAGAGGRTSFLASMCDLVGHGTVVALGAGADLPTHDRITVVDGDATDARTAAAVTELVGEGSAIVVLGGRNDRATTFREFKRLEGLVPVGSYVVVTDTIVNGRPVWPAFGPGPAEGVKQILGSFGDFVADPAMEKYSLTFNPGGFLKRIG